MQRTIYISDSIVVIHTKPMQMSFLINYLLHYRCDIIDMVDCFRPCCWLVWNQVNDTTQYCQSVSCVYMYVKCTILKHLPMTKRSNIKSGRLLGKWTLIECWKLCILFITSVICCLCQFTDIMTFLLGFDLPSQTVISRCLSVRGATRFPVWSD